GCRACHERRAAGAWDEAAGAEDAALEEEADSSPNNFCSQSSRLPCALAPIRASAAAAAPEQRSIRRRVIFISASLLCNGVGRDRVPMFHMRTACAYQPILYLSL